MLPPSVARVFLTLAALSLLSMIEPTILNEFGRLINVICENMPRTRSVWAVYKHFFCGSNMAFRAPAREFQHPLQMLIATKAPSKGSIGHL